jgi:hypothetical protein
MPDAVKSNTMKRSEMTYAFPFKCFCNFVAYRRILVENVELGGNSARKMVFCEAAICRTSG